MATTPSTTTKPSTVKKLYNVFKSHLEDFTIDDINVVKRFNYHDLHTTAGGRKNKGVENVTITPNTKINKDSKRRHNTRQSNSREYYRSGHAVDKMKQVLLNYDISSRPEQKRNSLQKFALVYVPVPLKLKARYNYLNHFPLNPRMQTLLSNYGYYLPGSLGVRRFGIYDWAYKPIGAIYSNIIGPEPESWYK